MTLVAEVILPLAVKSNFDYRVPPGQEVLALTGMRVLVVFGKKKIYTGVIRKVYAESNPDKLSRLKWIDEFPDKEPILGEKQLQLFEWISFYYFCTEGEVLKAALPAGLKLESALKIEAADVPNWLDLELTSREFDLLSRLKVQPSLNLQEVADLWGIQNPGPYLRNMEGRGLIHLRQRVEQAYKPKTEKYIEVAPEWQDEKELHTVFGALGNAPRQEEAMMLIVEAWFKKEGIARKELKKRLQGADSSVKALVEKGFVRQYEVEIDRLANLQFKDKSKDISYTAEQASGLEAIQRSFGEQPGKPVLLHGVTGSGKTHLYIDLIRETLEEERQVLYLLPEISLTQQIIDKVKTEFGDKVGVYHSRFNDAERVEIWNKINSREYQVVIGVRSAIFLPFKDLGLIVVDEEHDHSFKQTEPNPRYQARDLAIFATRVFKCNVLLGSATPSFETYYNARLKKFGLVEIKKRATTAKLPEIELIDLREETKKKTMKGAFSQPLIDQLQEVLEKGEQAILFQNRRGFAPFLICTNCGHVPNCMNCDISLTYHKAKKQLRCHYCGYTDYQVDKCEVCGHYELKQQGVGTERLEEEVKDIFPNARIKRMDLDTTRTRHGFLNIIRSFEKHEIDILVGTQMVSKGLDFENVTLVGVVQADRLLNFSDFRAYERAYQLLTQVSGRAGRSEKKGKVLIQTFMPDNPVLKLLQKDYSIFFDLELANRKELHYPPYTRLIRMEIRHKNQLFLEEQTMALKNLLLPVFKGALLGPEYPPITRLRNEYRQVAMIKMERGVPARKIRELLAEKIDEYYRNAPKKTLRITVDVDPY